MSDDEEDKKTIEAIKAAEDIVWFMEWVRGNRMPHPDTVLGAFYERIESALSEMPTSWFKPGWKERIFDAIVMGVSRVVFEERK